MTDAELQSALTASQYAASERERSEALRLVLAKLAIRGHFDHLGIRYSVGKDGTLERGLPL